MSTVRALLIVALFAVATVFLVLGLCDAGMPDSGGYDDLNQFAHTPVATVAR